MSIMKELFTELYGSGGQVYIYPREVALMLAGILYSPAKMKLLCVNLDIQSEESVFIKHLLKDALDDPRLSREILETLFDQDIVNYLYEI